MNDFDEPLVADLDAERAVLAAAMTSPEVTLRVLERLADHRDFARPAHQTIMWALADLAVTGRPTDPIALRDHLESRGELRQCGGAPYLAELYESLVAVGQAEYHADIVGALGKALPGVTTCGDERPMEAVSA